MKHLILSALLLIFIPLSAQNKIATILEQIMANNTSLKALEKKIEANKLEYTSDISMQDPVVEMNLLWGDPSGIGNRTDVSFQQSFEFPTVYRFRKSIAEARASQANILLDSYRLNLMQNAKRLCIELVFRNLRITELQNQLKHAEQLLEAYELMFEAGETNQIELNKARINVLNCRQSVKQEFTERNKLTSDLTGLNAGKPISSNIQAYPNYLLDNSFEAWFEKATQNNPQLKYLQQEIDIRKKETQLSKAMGLPKFSAGYLSEKTLGEQFQGVTLGMSIPVWENKNKVKMAKARSDASEMNMADARLTFYSQIKGLYNKAMELEKVHQAYSIAFTNLNNTELLKKALDNGEITLINYMLELSLYYDTINNWQKAERDYHMALADLQLYTD